ncbi:MAG: hypothetical protein J7L96_03460, partial [Bacteroidales bacterium]|nr:hypothetical protein [Bacteroidales bacterium]
MNKVEMVKNEAGRLVPTELNGKKTVPYQGVGKYSPSGYKKAQIIRSNANYPAGGDKRLKDLKEALIKAGLKDGMTISTHHHFRNGDLIANQVFDIANELGVRDLVWFPSASFPCHEHLIQYLEDGTI